MNIKYQIIVGFLALFLLSGSPALAVNATNSAKVSPEPSASGSASLIQKINEIKEKAASKAADLISQVAKRLQNKAYFGIVTNIKGDTVTISFQNQDFTISTTEYTGFASTIKSTKKTAALKDISTGDFISALGDVDDKGVLNAKKIIKSNPVATESATLVWGVVQTITGGTITVKTGNSTDQLVTAYGKSPVALGQQEGSLADVKVGRTIIARGKPTNNAGLTSTFIYVVPPSADAKPEKTESTRSAMTISASPSASPQKR